MKKIISTAAIAAMAFGLSATATAQEADLDSLLKKVREGRVTETSQHKEREQNFIQKRQDQQKLLQQEEAETVRLERESARLEDERRKNDAEITRVSDLKSQRLGQLQELFGVLQQAAGDAKSIITSSHVTIDNAGRLDEINALVDKTKDTAALPTLDEIRTWPAQMLLEAIESSKVVKFEQEVRKNDGTTEVVDLVRIGDFGLVGGEGIYYILKGGNVVELARQPSRHVGSIPGFLGASSGLAGVGIDPTRGQLLDLEVQKATIEERLEQGGTIGYLTLGLGAIGVVMAIFQFFFLFSTKGGVKSQIKNSTVPNVKNPLGRILKVYDDNKAVDVETLELKLDEAILKETPALERFLTPIKLISAVAPLFGLLGTVTGMIETFQAITLFGAGDPTVMAAGISAALMTTVLGLVVAIPTLLLHSFVAGSSKSVIHVLEEQAAGIIAVHAEKEHGNAGA